MAETQTEVSTTEHLDQLYPPLFVKVIKHSHSMYRTGPCLCSFEKVCYDCFKVLRYKKGDYSINLLLHNEGYPHVCRNCMEERLVQIKQLEDI